MHTTPVTLLERLRRPNEQEAWNRFVELYTPFLFSWARRIGLQDTDAADLVQDVFAILLQKLPDFVYDKRQSFRGWLHVVALNQWRASLRRRIPLQPGEEDALERVPAPSIEDFWEHDYRKLLVGQAMKIMQESFQPETWKACWECIVNGRSAVDVASEYGMSAGAVRAAKFRVLARLRQELDGLLE